MEHLRQLLNLISPINFHIWESKMMNTQKIVFQVFLFGLFFTILGCGNDDSLSNVGGAEVFFSDETYRIVESTPDPIRIPVNLDNGYHSGGSVTVSLEGAVLGEDYTLDQPGETFELIFGESETTKFFNITPLDNAILNQDREIEIRLSNPSENFKLGQNRFLQIILLDDEERMTAEVSFDPLEYEVEENDTLDIPIAFNNLSTDGGTIQIVAGGGDAIYGEDYILEGANEDGEVTLNVDPYADFATLRVIALDNEDFEDNKEFNIQILEVSGEIEIGESSIATVTILENDESPFASLGFDTSNASMAAENSGSVTLNINLSKPAVGNQTFEINYSNSSTAILAEDFSYLNGDTSNPLTVNLEDGATSASVTLELIDDEEEEGDETIVLNIANASGDLQIDPNNSTFTFTIQDDETENSGGTASSYLETFESAEDLTDPQLSDFGYASEVSSATTIAMPESSSISLNNADGKFSDADDVNATSDWGIQMGYVNKTTDGTSSGSIDNVVISPELGADDGSSYSFTYDASYSKPNSSVVVELYYSTDSDGSSFSNGNWTMAESFTEATMNADRNSFDRRTVTIPASGKFHVAIRITAEIGDANTSDNGTRWRFDNFRISNE